MRGVGGFLTPDAPICNVPLADCWYGLAPGAPCYDATHDAGMIHGGATVDSMFLSNVTTRLSQYELDCLAGKLVNVNPPSTPIGYDPSNPSAPLEPAPSIPTPILCADGTAGPCQTPATGACSSFLCGLPFASLVDSDCSFCETTTVGKVVFYGALGLLAWGLVKGVMGGAKGLI